MFYEHFSRAKKSYFEWENIINNCNKNKKLDKKRMSSWYSIKFEPKKTKYFIHNGNTTELIREPVIYPSICPCCGENISQMDNRIPVKTKEVIDNVVVRDTSKITIREVTYNFPMCIDCYNHARYWGYLNSISIIFFVLYLGIGFVISLNKSYDFLTLFTIMTIAWILSILFVIKKSYDHKKSKCVSIFPIRGGDKGELSFANRTYIERFAALNNVKLDPIEPINNLVEDNYEAPKQQRS